MVDRPSTSRVGRPRTRSAHQTPCIPIIPRSKSTHASKTTDSSGKVKQTPARSRQVRVISQPEPIVIDRDSDNSDLEFPFIQQNYLIFLL